MNYRTTRIYLRSLDLVELSARVIRELPPGYASLADQLRRSAASIPPNFLEGCGRTGTADRRRFFTIASGSAHEVAGTLDVMRRFSVVNADDLVVGHDLCDHIIAISDYFTDRENARTASRISHDPQQSRLRELFSATSRWSADTQKSVGGPGVLLGPS
jgi:four helix bundle protein